MTAVKARAVEALRSKRRSSVLAGIKAVLPHIAQGEIAGTRVTPVLLARIRADINSFLQDLVRAKSVDKARLAECTVEDDKLRIGVHIGLGWTLDFVPIHIRL